MQEKATIGGVDEVDRYIGRLYRCALHVAPDRFRAWALEQLRQVIDFDGALWGSGTAARMQFNTSVVIGIPQEFPKVLQASVGGNPMVSALRAQLDQPVDMRSVLPDDAFFDSELYRRTFQPFGIERIISAAHEEPSTRLYSLISLYRFDRGRPFSVEDHARQSRVFFHLINAASNAFYVHTSCTQTERPIESAAAAVDEEGVFHDAMPRFTELLDEYYPKRDLHVLPFELPPLGSTTVVNGLCVRAEPLADLRCVFIWPAGPLDRLTPREREIVYAVSQGLSFKQAARRIGIAPSTVANHLYRVYRKLGVSSRNALAGLVYPEAQA